MTNEETRGGMITGVVWVGEMGGNCHFYCFGTTLEDLLCLSYPLFTLDFSPSLTVTSIRLLSCVPWILKVRFVQLGC